MTVRNWSYRCELTLPQIDLMMSDLPHTLYKKRKTKETVTEDDEATRLNEESLRKAMERRERESKEQSYTIEQIFDGKADE